ncbi:zinc finger protein 438 [Ochotona curzoniae]|uniref:zinc finger protein 438 n=1 Tax=Ochotona curzoniae TaxID=130825 RepID=UPI001B34CFD2|nr:zinc finger protein 438 [Ochotona curzoniae]
MQNPPSVPPKGQGEPSEPPDMAHGGRGSKSKRQFRAIAPKIAPRALPPRVLPCPPPALTSKPLGLPTQNYALMQVSGQDGTFSLVALPPVAAALPGQKPRQPLGLKLPIPRYTKSPTSDRGSRKTPSLSPPKNHRAKPRALQRVPSLEPDPTILGMATASAMDSNGDPNPPGTNRCPATPALTSVKQPFTETPREATLTNRRTSRKPPGVTSGKCKAPSNLGKFVTMSSAMPWVPVPRGKLPIVRTRTTTAAVVVSKLESKACPAEHPFLGPRADCEQKTANPERYPQAVKALVNEMPTSQVPKQSLGERACCAAPKPDVNHKARPSSGAAKRRARKRKAPEDTVTFQGRRRKGRDGKERTKPDLQEARDPKPGAVTRYRSIMPKPVLVLPTLAPLASSMTLLQAQVPGSLGQAAMSDGSPISKYHSHHSSLSTRPISGFRNGLCGVKKPFHRCQVCSRHFQFKQHLRDHMDTHSANRRPYSCRLCRKAYVRAGSLNTHMRLHHGDSRLKRLMCCEFCAKVFGHIRVYLGHLKEVHRVVISTESAPSDPQLGDASKSKDTEAVVRGPAASLDRENKWSAEDLLSSQGEEVKLQIRCGRCQITAQSFADMEFHLLYAHGEEIQGGHQEGILAGSRGAREELVKQQDATAPQDQTPRPERGELAKPEEDYPTAVPQLCGQLHLHHQHRAETLPGKESTQPGTSEPAQVPGTSSSHSVLLWSSSGFHCILCTQTLVRKEELLLHWARQHNCEDPSMLWAVLSACSRQGVMELSSPTGKQKVLELG